MTANSNNYFVNIKPHFLFLDGLRGIAALVVVWFHIFEAFATSHLDQQVNHGYLAVDFFFLLSGFVIAYAYNDRWKNTNTWSFIKRRLIRLHPMVIIGALIGGLMFYLQVSNVWDVNSVSLFSLIVAVILNAFLIPALPSFEIRGLGEMFPLNGPSWSLFFEYLINILYALFLRKLSNSALKILVIFAGLGLTCFAIAGPLGDICAGYSLTFLEFLAGSLRVLFSFSAGLLIFRYFKPTTYKIPFWISAIVLIIVLAIPRLGDANTLWLNGIYDIICCVLLFPAILYLSASNSATNTFLNKILKLLGDISYPLYIIHYPFIYLYYAWVKNNQLTFQQSIWGALTLFFGCIILAYIILKYVDVPIRKLLSKKFM